MILLALPFSSDSQIPTKCSRVFSLALASKRRCVVIFTESLVAGAAWLPRSQLLHNGRLQR